VIQNVTMYVVSKNVISSTLLLSISFDDYFEVRSVLGTRGHAYKLFKPRCTASISSNFFAERVINIRNSLPVTANFSTPGVGKVFLRRATLKILVLSGAAYIYFDCLKSIM